MFDRIDHIGVAVEDLDAALALYEHDYDMTLVHREIVEEQGVEAVLLDLGENHVELLAALGTDTPGGATRSGPSPGPARAPGHDDRPSPRRSAGSGPRQVPPPRPPRVEGSG